MKRLVMLAVAMMAVVTAVLAEDAKVAAPAAAAPVAVKETSPSAGLSVAATLDLYSAYVWRGCVLNDRPVWQPGATVSYATGGYGTLSAGAWSNFDATDRRGYKKFAGITELDYTATYAIDVGPVSLSVGHTWYTFPSVTDNMYGKSSREVFVTAQYNTDIVNPFVRVYYDYVWIEGSYENVGFNKTIKVNDRLSVGTEISLGIGSSNVMAGYYGSNGGPGLADFNASLFASYALTDHISIGPRIAWMSLIDEDARKGALVDDQEILWGGVNLSASF